MINIIINITLTSSSSRLIAVPIHLFVCPNRLARNIVIVTKCNNTCNVFPSIYGFNFNKSISPVEESKTPNKNSDQINEF